MHLAGMNRYQAFGIHFGISLLIFIGLVAMVFLVWYPGLLFDSEEGWKSLVLIAGVDLVLGPLLTLLVFNPGKKSLKFDLALIFVTQISALCAGSYTIHNNRPVAWVIINPEKGAMTIYARSLSPELSSFFSSQNNLAFYLKLPDEDASLEQASGMELSPETLRPTTDDPYFIDTYLKVSSPDVEMKDAFNMELDKGLKDGVSLAFGGNGAVINIARQSAPVSDEQ